MIYKLTVKMLPKMVQIMHDGQRMKLVEDEVRGVSGRCFEAWRLQILHEIDFSPSAWLTAFSCRQLNNPIQSAKISGAKNAHATNGTCQKIRFNVAVSNGEATGCPGLWSISFWKANLPSVSITDSLDRADDSDNHRIQ